MEGVGEVLVRKAAPSDPLDAGVEDRAEIGAVAAVALGVAPAVGARASEKREDGGDEERGFAFEEFGDGGAALSLGGVDEAVQAVAFGDAPGAGVLGLGAGPTAAVALVEAFEEFGGENAKPKFPRLASTNLLFSLV